MHAAARRPRRDRHQDRAARRRRRHAGLGPAVPQGRAGERHLRSGVLPRLQPRQALGRGRLHHAGRTTHRARARARRRRAGRELQGRRPREVRARLRVDRGRRAAARLLLDHRLRPRRSLRRSRRLRLHRPGHVRLHERDRRGRRAPRRRTAEGGHRDHRPDDRHVRDRRDPGGARAPRPQRRGPARRLLPDGFGGRDDVGDEPELPRVRPRARPARQRAPEHRALRGLRLRRRPPHPRRRQRLAVREVLRGGGPRGVVGRSALRAQRRPGPASRRPRADGRGGDGDAHAARLARRARGGRRARRPDPHARPGVRGSARRRARPRARARPSARGDGPAGRLRDQDVRDAARVANARRRCSAPTRATCCASGWATTRARSSGCAPRA